MMPPFSHIQFQIACWCDTHVRPPFKVHPKRNPITVLDKRNFELSLYKDVIRVLNELKDNNVLIFSASRTHTPKVAVKLLKLFEIDHFFEDSEWGPGTKCDHIDRILSKHNHLTYSDMCLFDDELRNKDVERNLGVKFIHIPDEDIGLTYKIFQNGLKSWKTFNLTEFKD